MIDCLSVCVRLLVLYDLAFHSFFANLNGLVACLAHVLCVVLGCGVLLLACCLFYVRLLNLAFLEVSFCGVSSMS